MSVKIIGCNHSFELNIKEGRSGVKLSTMLYLFLDMSHPPTYQLLTTEQ